MKFENKSEDETIMKYGLSIYDKEDNENNLLNTECIYSAEQMNAIFEAIIGQINRDIKYMEIGDCIILRERILKIEFTAEDTGDEDDFQEEEK